MSCKAIVGLALSTLVSLCLPVQAEDTKITIIRPPPLAVNISPPREEVSVVNANRDNRSINQAVTVTVVTVATPYYGNRYRLWNDWSGRYEWTGYGLRGGTRTYSGPRYPF